MAFIDNETSQQGAEPVEYYTFTPTTGPVYRYTSSEGDVVFGGNTYTALPTTRTKTRMHPDATAPELEVTLPITAQVVKDYAFDIAPQEISFALQREHPTAGTHGTLWSGNVASFQIKGREAVLRVPHLLGRLMEDTLPKSSYQTLCNNVLFQGLCGVSRAAHLETTQVSSLNALQTYIVVDSLGARPTDWALGGEIVNTVTGESRMIINQIGTGASVGLLVMWPFSDLSALDDIEVSAGCDHSIDTCFNKFSQHQDFTGFPFMQNLTLKKAGN